MDKRPKMPPNPEIPAPQNRGGGPPKPPPDRYYYQTISGEYHFRYPFAEMKFIMQSKTFTGDMWRLGQAWKRLMKAIKKTWPFKQIDAYLK